MRLVVKQCDPCFGDRIDFFELTHDCKYYFDRKGSAGLLTSIQSAGVTPVVNLGITQARKHAKEIHPGFETRGRHHQKSKTGDLPKRHRPSKFFSKKDHLDLSLLMFVKIVLSAFLMVVLNRKITFGRNDWILLVGSFGIPAVPGVIFAVLGWFGPSGFW